MIIRGGTINKSEVFRYGGAGADQIINNSPPASLVLTCTCAAPLSCPTTAAPTATPVPTRLQVWGWNFGGSLADLVDQIGLSWWPGLNPLKNVGVEINVGDPFTLGYVSNQTMMALPPVTTAQPTR